MDFQNMDKTRQQLLAMKLQIFDIVKGLPDNVVIFSLIALLWGYYVNADAKEKQNVRKYLEREWERIRDDALQTVTAQHHPEFSTPQGRLQAAVLKRMEECGRELTTAEVVAMYQQHMAEGGAS